MAISKHIGRKLKRYIVTLDSLGDLFKTGSKFEIVDGLPEGAKVVGCSIDTEGYAFAPTGYMLNVYVEHDSFEEMPLNGVIPSEGQIKINSLE